LKLNRTPAEVKTATPELGEHTENLLNELGYSKKEILEFVNEKVV
jgi:crotonobetainyl-CoA:carnitine CoA-transferase CaiB-like acyl-CoA transferase